MGFECTFLFENGTPWTFQMTSEKCTISMTIKGTRNSIANKQKKKKLLLFVYKFFCQQNELNHNSSDSLVGCAIVQWLFRRISDGHNCGTRTKYGSVCAKEHVSRMKRSKKKNVLAKLEIRLKMFKQKR